MTTLIYPPISPAALHEAQRTSLARELQWYLSTLHTETLPSLKSGLTECDRLLSPASGAHTLVLSSLRSESIKGTVTRTGSYIIKGDVAVKLTSIPPPRAREALRMTINTAATADAAPRLQLEQLTRARNLISAALDVVDVTLWTGDKTDSAFMRGQMQLLYEHVQEAKAVLKGSGLASALLEPSGGGGGASRPMTPTPGGGGGQIDGGAISRPRTPNASVPGISRPTTPRVPTRTATPSLIPPSKGTQAAQPPAPQPPPPENVDSKERPWYEDTYEDAVFDPAPPPNVSFHLSIADAALVLQVRALENAAAPNSHESITGLGIRERLGLTTRPQTHEEIGQVFRYKGEHVRVKEKLRVASQDPSLLAAMAKLGAVEHSVAMSRGALDAVMGRGGGDDDDGDGDE